MAVNIRSIKIAVISVLVLAISIGGVIFAGYLVKLDREIRDRFAGARWALPAQVYAAPQELYAGLPLNSGDLRSEEHTSELQSLMRISYAVFCLKKKK